MSSRGARFVLLAVCSGALALATLAGVAADVPPDQQSAVLAAHNSVRRMVASAESQRLGQTVTIPDLIWNADAAAVAQAWANTLLATNSVAHNPNAAGYGENVYMESGLAPAGSGVRAVQSWASEAADYNWDSNSCSSDCGHYTQIVWASTTSVGCGEASDGTNTYWVCDYAPQGNFAGQRPYEPGAGAAPPSAAPPASPPPADANQPPALTTSLTGSWLVDDFGYGAGGTLSLVQVGDQVAGIYAYDDPSGCGTESGTLIGRFDGATLSFTTFETGCGGDRQGGGTVDVSADGNALFGAFNAARAEQ